MDSLQPLGSLADWVRGNAPEPNDKQNACLRILDFLEGNNKFIQGSPDLASKMVSLLDKSDLSQIGMSETAWKTYRTLYLRHPNLYTRTPAEHPKMILKMNGKEYTVPKNRLWSSSEVFRKHFNHSSAPLELTFDDPDGEVGEIFLNFLGDGKIPNIRHYCIPLLKFAQSYFIEDLEAKVVDYIENNLSHENLPILFGWAIKLGHQRLTTSCLGYIWNERTNIRQLTMHMDQQNGDLDTEAAKVLQLARLLRLQGLTANINNQRLEIGFSKLYKVDATNLAALNALCKRVALCLKLVDVPYLDDTRLENVLKALPDLKHLYIKSNKVTKIPFSERFMSVICNDCEDMTHLDLSAATEIECNRCAKLTSIAAGKAESLFCEGCPKLESINAPKVTWLNCSVCPSLTSLDMPAAKAIYCLESQRLVSLKAPLAKKVSCEYCPSLISLEAPEALKVNCSNCTSLTSLIAPKARSLFFQGCDSLTHVDSPNAELINGIDCKSLVSLILPSAKKFSCDGCMNLTQITADKAIKFSCGNCANLSTIHAPSVIEVDFRGCGKLSSVYIPKATRVLR